MKNYEPWYDTTIDSETYVKQHDTVHLDAIDWEHYPFEHPQDDEYIKFLRICEKSGCDRVVTDYGGMPRIWDKVIGVAMASCWPYWTPRPTVIAQCPLGSGCKFIDYRSIRDAKVI